MKDLLLFDGTMLTNKVVSMLLSRHTGELVDTGKADFASKENILKPDAIADYNQNVGGVDLLSRVIVPYSIQRKDSNKWYRKIGELFTELLVYNAFIVWKNLDNSAIDQLKFYQQPIEEITTFHLSGQPKFSVGCRQSSENIEISSKKAANKRGKCVRFNKLGIRH